MSKIIFKDDDLEIALCAITRSLNKAEKKLHEGEHKDSDTFHRLRYIKELTEGMIER